MSDQTTQANSEDALTTLTRFKRVFGSGLSATPENLSLFASASALVDSIGGRPAGERHSFQALILHLVQVQVAEEHLESTRSQALLSNDSLRSALLRSQFETVI